MSHFSLWNRCVTSAPVRRTGEFPKPNVRVMISCIEWAADWTFWAPTISFPFSLLGQALAPGRSVSKGPHLHPDDRVKDAAVLAAGAGWWRQRTWNRAGMLFRRPLSPLYTVRIFICHSVHPPILWHWKQSKGEQLFHCLGQKGFLGHGPLSPKTRKIQGKLWWASDPKRPQMWQYFLIKLY